MSTVVSRSPEETRRLGREFGGTLRAGDVVLLEGDLGAGKTTFVKGIADACGVTVEVRSPTFALMHRYRGKPDWPFVALQTGHDAMLSAPQDIVRLLRQFA